MSSTLQAGGQAENSGRVKVKILYFSSFGGECEGEGGVTATAGVTVLTEGRYCT
jgi:hypothetical protein